MVPVPALPETGSSTEEPLSWFWQSLKGVCVELLRSYVASLGPPGGLPEPERPELNYEALARACLAKCPVCPQCPECPTHLAELLLVFVFGVLVGALAVRALKGKESHGARRVARRGYLE